MQWHCSDVVFAHISTNVRTFLWGLRRPAGFLYNEQPTHQREKQHKHNNKNKNKKKNNNKNNMKKKSNSTNKQKPQQQQQNGI